MAKVLSLRGPFIPGLKEIKTYFKDTTDSAINNIQGLVDDYLGVLNKVASQNDDDNELDPNKYSPKTINQIKDSEISLDSLIVDLNPEVSQHINEKFKYHNLEAYGGSCVKNCEGENAGLLYGFLIGEVKKGKAIIEGVYIPVQDSKYERTETYNHSIVIDAKQFSEETGKELLGFAEYRGNFDVADSMEAKSFRNFMQRSIGDNFNERLIYICNSKGAGSSGNYGLIEDIDHSRPFEEIESIRDMELRQKGLDLANHFNYLVNDLKN